MLRRIFILTIAIGFSTAIMAQGFYGRNNWKNRKHEFAIGGGASGFLGDLGGGSGTGGRGSNTSYTPLDYDFPTTRFGLTFEYMLRIGSKTSLRWNVVYGQIEGDDQYSSFPGRQVRSMKFNSHLWEVSNIFIYHFNREQIGHLYSLRNPAGGKLGIKAFKVGTYVFAGVGATYFNPYADGVALKPLGTSGQNIDGYGLDSYSNFTASFPLGFGARHSINGSTGVKLELGYRFTLSDWMDDVAAVKYANPVEVQMAYNGQAEGNASYYAQPAGTPHATLRGDRENDGYMFLMMTFYFNRDPRHWFNDARRKPIKVRRPRASF